MMCRICDLPLRGLLSTFHALCYWDTVRAEQAAYEKTYLAQASQGVRRYDIDTPPEIDPVAWYMRSSETINNIMRRPDR